VCGIATLGWASRPAHVALGSLPFIPPTPRLLPWYGYVVHDVLQALCGVYLSHMCAPLAWSLIVFPYTSSHSQARSTDGLATPHSDSLRQLYKEIQYAVSRQPTHDQLRENEQAAFIQETKLQLKQAAANLIAAGLATSQHRQHLLRLDPQAQMTVIAAAHLPRHDADTEDDEDSMDEHATDDYGNVDRTDMP
jgi:hypothetical protein